MTKIKDVIIFHLGDVMPASFQNKRIYFYNDFTLYKACLNILYISYNDVTRSIRYYLKRYSNKYSLSNIDELINFLVGKYLMLKKRKQQRDVLIKVINNENLNIKYVSNVLKVNYKRIFELTKYGYCKNHSILIIYFIGDIFSEFKSISQNKIKMILNSEYQESVSDINELICFYYINKSDIIVEKIINLYSIKFRKWIQKISNQYFGGIKSWNIDDIVSDLYIFLLQLLKDNRIIMNNSCQINSYIFKTMRGLIYKKLIEIKKLNFEFHLEDNITEDLTFLDVLPISQKY